MADVERKILEVQVDYGDALEKIAQYRIEIDNVKKKQKELKEELKAKNISEVEYQKSMEASRQIISRLNAECGVYTKQISNQIKVQKEQQGSLVGLRAKLSDLTAQYDRLSKADREAAKGMALKKQMNELTTEIKGLEEATQRYYRNVGNYPQTMASLGAQLDAYVAKLREMQAANQEGTKEFEEMAAKAESLRETLATASEGGSSSMGDLATGIANLGMGFLAWGEILDRAGLKNEECEKTLSQMMVVITAVGTAWKIYNAVQKEGAIYTAALSLKTTLLNTALGKKIAASAAATTATAAETTATGAATTATTIFNAVLYANPLMWLVGIIMVAVAAIYGLVKAFQFFTGSTEDQKKALEEQGKQLEIYCQQLDQTKDRLAAMGATEEELTNITIEHARQKMIAYDEYFSKVQNLYDSDEQEYKDALDRKLQAHQDYLDALETGHNRVLSKIAEWDEANLKATMTENEWAVHQIDVAYKELIETCETYYAHQMDSLDSLNLSIDEHRKRIEQLTDAMNQEKQKLSNWYMAKTNQYFDYTVDPGGAILYNIKPDAPKKPTGGGGGGGNNDAKKKEEEERKRQEAYEKEFQAAQDALVNIMKEGLDKQLKIENLAYERQLKALREKNEKVQKDSKASAEYKLKYEQEINTQIEALELMHQHKLAELQWSEKERQIKIEQELLQSKLDIIKKGTEEEMAIRLAASEKAEELERETIKKRIADQELSQEQGDELLLNLTREYEKQRIEIKEEYAKLAYERQKSSLEAEVENMQMAEEERQQRLRYGREMTDEQYQRWRERGLAQMEEHQRNLLIKEEEAAQAALDALIARGQLSTQTEEEYQAEIRAARQKTLDATKKTNEQIIANEKAKLTAVSAVTSSLCSLMDTLGEENEALAKASKIIALAQIAIDTGVAISEGIKSASGVPFPGNIAAIATTIATVIANIATAISTVKSAKFAQGGKVIGPGTGTSDSIPAMLSNGEYVMTAKATKMFEPLLMAMNNIGAGIPMQVMDAYRGYETNESLTNSFTTAVQDLHPVVSVVEISETQNRVKTIESLDNY